MTMWRRLRAFSLPELCLLGQAVVLLAAARACLPLVGFRAVAAIRPGEVQAALSRGELDRAQSLARLVGIASRHGFVRTTCLHRALVLRWMLLRRGIRCAFHLGTRPEPGAFEAHAWIDCGGVPIGEDAGHLAGLTAFDGAVSPSIGLSRPWGKR